MKSKNKAYNLLKDSPYKPYDEKKKKFLPTAFFFIFFFYLLREREKEALKNEFEVNNSINLFIHKCARDL